MTNDSPDFYLASSEGYDLEAPRRCFRIKRLGGDFRDDYLLIKVDPPLVGQSHALGGQDVDQIVIAPRHRGVSLFPILEWPVFVHVVRVLVDDPEIRDKLHDSELEEIAWAELYQTEKEALDQTM